MTASRPKLAYVVGTLHPGGTERLVLRMSRFFAAGFDVSVVCLDEPGDWAGRLRRLGIPVYCVWRQPGLDLAVAWKLARAFRRLGVEIVHAHQCTPWFYAALSRVLYRAPRLVFQEHGRFYPEVDKPVRRLVNRLLVRKLTHRFVAVSRDVRERLVRYEGLDRDEIQVIYNGIGAVTRVTDEERSRMRAGLGFRESDFIAGTVGRIDPVKNLPMFVDAVVEAARHDDRMRGLVIGDGPAFGDIERRIVEGGVVDRITMTGYRGDAAMCMQCLDLFVLCSFSEGTSVALLEAMAAGIPAVVTEVGGNPEVVDHETTGWTVPSGSVEALAARMREASGDGEAARLLGRRGREKVEQQFSFQRMAESYDAIYRALLPVCVNAETGIRAGSPR